MSFKDNTYKESNAVAFLFNKNRTLKKTFLKESTVYFLIPYIQYDILMESWQNNVEYLKKERI